MMLQIVIMYGQHINSVGDIAEEIVGGSKDVLILLILLRTLHE